MRFLQIGQDGIVIRTWESMRKASITLGLSMSSLSVESRDGTYHTVGGFYWRRETTKEVVDGVLNNVEDLNNRRGYSAKRVGKEKVLQIASDGVTIIREWPSLKEASVGLNINQGNLSLSMKDGVKRRVGGFYWRKSCVHSEE